MDPFVALHAREGTALLLDCRSLEHRPVPIDSSRLDLVAADSGVRHALAAGEYNRRRSECEEAVASLRASGLEIGSLRDVREGDLQGRSLAPTLLRRARHVTSENRRTEEAARALEDGDYEKLGALLDASHESLREEYEVSCPELDALVEIARAVPGVYGSRMTGGGFGGSTVSALRPEAVPRLLAAISSEYPARTGREARARRIRPSGPASVERA
jgi:galactokinase